MVLKLDKKFILQFGSYLIVGVIATAVEWICYAIFDNGLHINTYVAVALAFIISTFANWLAGRLMTFKNADKNNMLKEIVSIYGAAVVGLALNELIMWVILNFIFVQASSFEKMFAKMVATGIVFFWNFFIRKLVIYKEKDGKTA